MQLHRPVQNFFAAVSIDEHYHPLVNYPFHDPGNLMMITEEHRKEQLSRAYVTAVAADAGLVFEPTSLDYGVDGQIRQVRVIEGRRIYGGHSLDVQLKATTTWSLQNDEIVYDLEAKTFNDLVSRYNQPRATPLVLMVLCLPQNCAEWLDIGMECLTLRNCCYWCQVGDEPTPNSSSKRIKIPTANVVNQQTVTDLLDRVVQGTMT